MSEFVQIFAITVFAATLIAVVIAFLWRPRNRPENRPENRPKIYRVVGIRAGDDTRVTAGNVRAMCAPSKQMVGDIDENVGIDATRQAVVKVGNVTAGGRDVGGALSSPEQGEELSWKDDYLKRELSTPYKLQGKCGALIVCNFFDDESKKDDGWPKKREGAQCDLQGLKELFDESLRSEFAFVDAIKNVDGKDLENVLTNFRQKLIDKKCGSFILAVSSHVGCKSNSILMNDREEKNVYRDFVYQFSHERFSQFTEKPKIFLVQACQNYTGSEEPLLPSGSEDTIQDVLVAFATTPYQVALRSKETGSVFIQSVVETFTEHALKNNLREMLLKVHQDVCQKTEGVKDQIMQTVLVSDIGFKTFNF